MVIVRIWASGMNINIEGENVGHVSIETPSQYMSLWPNRADGEGKGMRSAVTHELLPSYDIDLQYEDNRPPEIISSLHTLDIEAIEREFEMVKDELGGWCLFGNCKNAESCVSLAYRLLQAGGINRLLGGNILSNIQELSMGSKGASQGGLQFFKHEGSSVSYGIASQQEQAANHRKQGSRAFMYSAEMAVSPIIKSPDFFVELIKAAKLTELKKVAQSVPNETDFTKGNQIEKHDKCCVM